MVKDDEFIEVTHPVAVLDEHWMVHPETGEPIYISPDRLKKIADNMNRRLQLTSDESPIVVGHTRDGVPEHEQPEVVGFARDFYVAPFYRTGKKALFSRWRVYKDKVPLLRKFPRRSVELWLDRWEVDPISLLGATTPDRDLGPVKLAAPKHSTVTRIFESENMDTEAIVQQVIAALMQTPQMQFLEQLMSEAQGMGQPGQEGAPEGQEMPAGEPAGEPGAEEEPVQHAHGDAGWGEGGENHYTGDGSLPKPAGSYEHPEVYNGPDDFRERTSNPIQKSAAGGFASGSNTFVAGDSSVGRKKYSRGEQELRVRLDRAEQANRIMLAKFARAERGRELAEMAANESIDLDVNEELDRVAPENGQPMPEALYRKHVDLIRKRYQRAPVGQKFIPTVQTKAGHFNQKELVNQAVELATNKGIPFEEALEQVSR